MKGLCVAVVLLVSVACGRDPLCPTPVIIQEPPAPLVIPKLTTPVVPRCLVPCPAPSVPTPMPPPPVVVTPPVPPPPPPPVSPRDGDERRERGQRDDHAEGGHHQHGHDEDPH